MKLKITRPIVIGLCIAFFLCTATVTGLTGFDWGLTKGLDNGGFKANVANNNIEDLKKLRKTAVLVNGRPTVFVADDKAVEELVAALKGKFVTPGSQVKEVKLAETLEGAKITTTQPALTVEEAVAGLLNGGKSTVEYTVVGGDNIWDIAISHKISPYELIAMNPGSDKHLSIGQKIKLTKVEPFVHVVTTEILTAEEKIDYPVTTEKSQEMYAGQTKVKVVGVQGSKTITKEIIKVNEGWVSEKVLAQSVSKEPVTQVNIVGTKAAPARVVATNQKPASGGSLGAPLAYIEVSSPYGSRGGYRHLGTDMRIPRGSAIFSAGNGTVTKAQNQGSFGKLIVINHGGGLETYYAHCDTIGVCVGDSVAQGQAIGTVGRTGNATGYILHFEVRQNGVAQNPMNYL